MDYLPAFLDIRNTSSLVIGGGDVAARKVELLLRAQGNVTVVASELNAMLITLLDGKKIRHKEKIFSDEDLDGCALVIAATDDKDLNKRVSELATARSLPVNVVDQPELCTFIFPSVIDRSPIVVAVSSGGSSPILARMLRAKLETRIPATYGRLAEMLASYRGRVKQRFNTTKDRRHFWEKILYGPVPEMVFSGREENALKVIEQSLNENQNETAQSGEVALVGAGPGDPDLLTFRAMRLMQQADVVLYDRLVPEKIVDLTRRDAERIYVGKKRAYHSMRQEEINQTLVTLAKQGKRVVRLKGGDPFVFGRGGEEIATLAREHVPFQIVPGITAANGCACYAGIPLTHRDYAQSVKFVTGQLKGGSVDLDWPSLVQSQQTVVIYMGLAGLKDVCEGLMKQGMSENMPVALIQQGTLPDQQVLCGTLESMPDIVAKHEIHAPTLLIIGEVVRLRDSLSWFENQ